ncbi:hypothetical protein CEXT_380271 [Caerostris extrusa]|uniref:EGF-like domain-containing protein n=1 Tax=Caerostris extrusa TaxID=172846 RepID=A0AAV4P484_CAEEX|nr:hypothetical protein CEXT_380271 [Caerostris extrusa]
MSLTSTMVEGFQICSHMTCISEIVMPKTTSPKNKTSQYFVLDSKKGELKLSQPITTNEPLQDFGIYAEDGGSPKRWAYVPVSIVMRALSAKDISLSIHQASTNLVECENLTRLFDNVNYNLEIVGWNSRGEFGVKTEIFEFHTPEDFCKQKCAHGTCKELNREPWYKCECPSGYSGQFLPSL